ncbi:MAG: hypothetical protein AAGC60_29210 [Acidobacteriota bacterium]
MKSKNRLKLKVLPVRRLGVDKALLQNGAPGFDQDVTGGCRATQGGSCNICCTGTS